MRTKTRFFVIASLLVLGVGLSAGMVAYQFGFATSALSSQGGPDELKFLPANASLVAHAEVSAIMASPLRQQLRALLPAREDGQRDLQERTGINIETDIDSVTAAAVPPAGAQDSAPIPGIAIVKGRFDQVKIEALMREQGGEVQEYKSKRIVVARRENGREGALAFLEPGMVALGSLELVRGAVDLKDGGASVVTNDDVMRLVRDIDRANAWAVGRFDAFTSRASFPSGMSEKIPAISWLSASAQIDSGLHGVLRADANDAQSADSLREVIRGVMALAKLQTGGRQELQSLLQSIQLSGAGNTVVLSFDLPAEMFDALTTLAGRVAPAK